MLYSSELRFSGRQLPPFVLDDVEHLKRTLKSMKMHGKNLLGSER
jgi:hypothetical protein